MRLRASTRSIIDLPAAGRNRPQAVAETIKAWISSQDLQPGERLPQEHELIEYLQVSKGTMREALKVLETQGLIRTRTGPGGGAFITEVSQTHAIALLGNHFFFKELTITQIYELRIALEPQLVLELAEIVTPDQLGLLRQCLSAYDAPPESIRQEREQRVAELEFHITLAGFSANPILSVICSFLATLLKDLTVCKRIYEKPNPELRARGVAYQQQLIEALEARSGKEAHAIMLAHMIAAKRIMVAQEAIIKMNFL